MTSTVPRITAPRITILGGGVAGLAAALELTERGVPVRLIEARPWLGGRVFSLAGERDNGMHVMLGCYDAMRLLLRRLGTEDRFLRQSRLRLQWRMAGGEVHELRTPALPGPLHLLVGILGLRAMPWRERKALLGAMLRLGFGSGAREGETVAQWQERRGQHGGPARLIWQPLCRAVMNEAPERTSARLFLETLRIALRGSASRSAIWVPMAPWAQLVGVPAAEVLAKRGAELLLAARAARILCRDGRAHAVVLTDGRELDVAPGLVAALPWHALAKLLADSDLGRPPSAGLRPVSIVNVHARVLPELVPDEGPLVALVDAESFHWLARRPGDARDRINLISGGARELDGLSKEAILVRASADLVRHYPGSLVLDPQTSLVVREHAATFAPSAESAALRPGTKGPAGMVLAGDWTDTGLPATLEGAALSGLAAARTVLEEKRS